MADQNNAGNTKELINVEDDIKVLNEALTETGKFLPRALEATTKAKLLLSPFIVINDDETEEKARKALKDYKATFEAMQEGRKAITNKLDGVKQKLMIPEKSITIDPKDSDADYTRVKGLLNEYQNKKIREAEEKREAAEKKQKRENALVELRAAIEKNVAIKVQEYANKINGDIADFIGKTTLENFDTREKQFNLTPTLKPEVWASFFEVDYDKELLNAEDHKAIVDELSAEALTYEAINAKYVSLTKPTIEKAKADLPELKQKLENIARLEQQDKEAAQRAADELKEQQLKEKQEAERKAETERLAAEKLAAQKEGESKLDNEFEKNKVIASTVVKKNNSVTKSYAFVNCEPEELIKVVSELMFVCFNHPKFKGHIKTDKNGVPQYKTLEDGITQRPVYEEWLEVFLKFYADKIEHKTVNGITIKEVAATRL